MTIEWIGQSGYIVRSDSTEIVIDPYLSDVVGRLANKSRIVPAPIEPADIKADAVVCTHDHLDHIDIDSIPLMDDSLAFITTNEGKQKILSLGKKKVTALNVGESVSVGDMTITAVYANHTVEAFGVVVKCGGMTLYFSGDTLYDEKLFEISKYHPDYTFICINGKLGNMNVDEALTTARRIGAKFNVPNHYGMFAENTEDPSKFTDKIDGGFTMDIAVRYEITENGLFAL